MRAIRAGLPVRVRVAGARRLLRGVTVEPAYYSEGGGPGAVIVQVGLRRLVVSPRDVRVIRRPAEAALVLAKDRALREEVRRLAGALQGKRGSL